MSKVHYTQCPVCSGPAIHPLLTVTDYTVSQEEFVIWQCAGCTVRFTQDVPDEEEIGNYYKSENYISHTNTSKGIINKLYQRVRTFTLKQKKKWVQHYTGRVQGSLLDIGAGTGAFLHTMKKEGWQVTGIEPDEAARKAARQTYALDIKSPHSLQDLSAGSFDAITLWHVLEHVHALHPQVEELKRLLKPEGSLFIAVPNYQSLDAAAYGLYWAAYDVPRHLYHFTPASVQVLMQQHGLKIVATKPMWFDSFYISLLSSKYRNGRVNWPGAGWNGLRSNVTALLNKERCSSLIYIVRKV